MTVRVQRLGLGDIDRVAAIHRAAVDQRLPWLAGLHTPAQDRAFFRRVVFHDATVLGALEGASLAGFIAVRPGWVDHLYVLPDRQGRGIGGTLLDAAKTDSVKAGQSALSLWTFQRNAAARRFYLRHGFVQVEETDGSRNEEREPDVLYRWEPADAGVRHNPVP